MKQWYEMLFENYAKKYDTQSYVTGTLGEVDFLEKELEFDKTRTILDIGCGTGRHSIELAKRGYKVTGVDLSRSQLQWAQEKAIEAKVSVDFIQKDARNLQCKNCFDVAIMLCEGGFSLMETDEMNFQILQNAADALKENGKFIFTTLNALFPLTHSLQDFESDEHKITDFDLNTFRQKSILKTSDDFGQEMVLDCNVRYYCPSEITWYLKTLKFREIGIYGCKLGAFSREKSISKDDFEILVIARK
jgi:2-polyprenyl-3-methyl-5-hydroxy-6-metoxy-1,4-benzoquinol methylase